MHAVPAQPAWFCLRARPLREALAAQHLQTRVAVEVFSPRIRVKRPQKSGVVRHLVEALFPGYLFARFRYPDQVRHVLSTQGVMGLVSIGPEPRPVDDAVINFLREQVSAAADPAAPMIEEGDWVRVIEGAFRNTEGRVLACDPRTNRVRLLLRVLGRDVQISLSRNTVVPQKDVGASAPPSLRAAEPAAC